jgi:hypothetical protein
MESCIFCGSKIELKGLRYRKKWVCPDCQLEIATVYAHDSMPPVELLYLKHKKDDKLKTIKM